MPNYRRTRIGGGWYFFTAAPADRGSALLVDRIADLRASFAEVRRRRPFRTVAAAVLPDHLHMIWALPDGDSDFPVRWKEIKCGFTKRVGICQPRSACQHRKGEAGIWQRRYWERCLRDEAAVGAHMEYFWRNPVKHGLVSAPGAWPYSSIHRDMREGQVLAGWIGQEMEGEFGE